MSSVHKTLRKISITFGVAGNNSFFLVHFLDKDRYRQVTEAGVVRGAIQKPERSFEEVSICGFSRVGAREVLYFPL